MFAYRARQKLITKETAMPGESKALRPLRVVLRRGTSLILCPSHPPRLRPEPMALPQTENPAKQVSEQKMLAGVETEKVLVRVSCRMFRGLLFCWKMKWKIFKNNKGM